MKNFLKKLLILTVLGVLLLPVSPSQARDNPGMISYDGFIGVGSEPFPSILSVAFGVSLADALRLYLSTDLSGVVQALSFRGFKLGAGTAARLRIPHLRLSPVIGFGYSTNVVVGTITQVYGSLDVDARFLTPSAGIEYRFSPYGYVGAGLEFPWMSDPDVIQYTRVDGIFPYFQLGLYF